MKALVWEAPRVMNVRERSVPQPASGEVLVRVGYAGICGSELSGYLGHSSLRVPPLVMGHEFAGTIEALGDGVTESHPRLAVGSRVTVNPLVSCGACEYCRRGLDQLCVHRKLLGAHVAGAYAEYVAAPARNAIQLPDDMPTRVGALTEPVAVGVRIAEVAGEIEGATALVIGAGPIGLLALQALRSRGASNIFISDRDAGRLAMGAALGGVAVDARSDDVVRLARDATGGIGVAAAVDAVGLAVTRAQCVAATRSAGTVVFSGLHEETSSVPASDIIRREITVQGSFAYTQANFSEALQRLAEGSIRLDPWVVEAPLEEGGRWFERLLDAPGDVSKVLLVP